ncbi:MAG: NAD(P)/FAD-dependent oxidoreductase [Alphaproteobacteria bacterium]|nr:NAD(P)/FAD-dependent oxidoreductase [Alphaproteobacteria bacterium]
MPHHKTNVTIIGAGPVGLFAIFQCGMLGLQCHVIDALDSIGGQCTALYPEKPIYDIPAYPKIDATELIHNLHQQALPFKPVFHLDQQVRKLTQQNDQSWLLETSNGQIIQSRTVIIAAGVGAFGPNRPPLEKIEIYENKSVFYYVKQKELFRNKTLVIAGGGDSAIDWTLSLSEIAQKIYLVHRRHKFRASPESIHQLEKLKQTHKIELITPYQLTSLEGDNGYLNNVIVQDLDQHEKKLEADYLLAFFGLSMDLGPITQWGLHLDHHHIAINPANQRTNLPGIYAIGDIVHYQGKLKLILTGFHEAAVAAHDIRKYLHPDEVFHFEYSTTKGISTVS